MSITIYNCNIHCARFLLGNRVELNKLCNALTKFEITPEDILAFADEDKDEQRIDIDNTVDSTVCDSTSSSPGLPKAAKRPKKVELPTV